MSTPADIEAALRRAPTPAPAGNLAARLRSAVRLPVATPVNGQAVALAKPEPTAGWFQRWWPALLAGGALAAGATALGWQEVEIHDLRQTLAASTQPAGETAPPAAAAATALPPVEAVPSPDERAEMVRLREEVTSLRADLAALTELTAENARLKGQLAGQSGLTAEEETFLDEARARAASIRCVNNLKQLGLGLRVWAVDNKDTLPPDLLSITNELSTPKVLFCPADTTRKPADDWAGFTPASSSYEFLAPGASESDPQLVAGRCLVHGHILLMDGSVQMSTGDGSNIRNHLVTRDGKLRFE